MRQLIQKHYWQLYDCLLEAFRNGFNTQLIKIFDIIKMMYKENIDVYPYILFKEDKFELKWEKNNRFLTITNNSTYTLECNEFNKTGVLSYNCIEGISKWLLRGEEYNDFGSSKAKNCPSCY